VRLRPLHDRLVVERIQEGETAKGGIVIPDTAKEKPQQGVVLAVGSGRRLPNGAIVPPEVKVNDQILFGKYSGSEVRLDEKEYLILREDEVLAVLESTSESQRQKAA
jgi:chaperonin GroES